MSCAKPVSFDAPLVSQAGNSPCRSDRVVRSVETNPQVIDATRHQTAEDPGRLA